MFYVSVIMSSASYALRRNCDRHCAHVSGKGASNATVPRATGCGNLSVWAWRKKNPFCEAVAASTTGLGRAAPCPDSTFPFPLPFPFPFVFPIASVAWEYDKYKLHYVAW